VCPVLCTGSSGFIGSHLVKTLTDSGEDVIALVRDLNPSSRWLTEALGRSIVVLGDVRKFRLMKRIIAQYEVTHVVHCAAWSSVKTAFKNPVGVYETNILGTVNVLEACRQVGVEKVLVMITDKIFGEKLDATENDPLQASEPYATSKACVDLLCDSYHKTYGLNVIRVRPCNVYGLDLYSNRIIPNTIKECLRNQPPIIFKGEQKSVRQYIHVADVVSAIMKLINQYSYGAFNICTEGVLNQADVVLEILKHFPKLEPKYVKREHGPKEIMRQSMILTSFGWKPKYAFDKGIEETIKKFRKYAF